MDSRTEITPTQFEELDPILVVQRDPAAGDVVVALDRSAFASPASWGILLADLVGHIANAYQQDGYSGSDVRRVLIEVLDAELERPTDKPIAMRWSES